jgi:hypothetical protein
VRGRIGGEPPFICDGCVEAIFLELFPLVRPEAGSPLTRLRRFDLPFDDFHRASD